ncbi:hypothetical protein CW751_14285 [Brumimicrobium salinarum]|uniref:THUMP domain-containing protein n=1 Tax=Brumimicrobium salinarum TaxID=2058658 RepID=A0A2I0QZ28_9FLAO|nr:hypothetical protein [Brumimicrobium salinarum]PKR79584.1 hypothetical protein CW751_14285 [Brumimicrobium salinarum]
MKGAVFSTLFSHTQYPFLVVKDAIADVFRDKCDDKRPDVNLKAPQVMFDVYIKEKSVVISLNTSGVPLFQRGYRQEVGEAPMNEVLAAGILRLSGWDKKSTLIDPMCGSGTIAIEAALWAADIPAMIERNHFAFKNFKSFDADAWEKVRQEGNHRPVKLDFDIIGSDIDGEMVQKAKRNSRVAPIGNMIKWEIKDALDWEAPDDKGVLICNPPYGERMGEEVQELYTGLGDVFKQKFLGYDCWVVSSNIDALKNLGLKPNQKVKVYNGSLECSLRQFKIFAGTKKYDNSAADKENLPDKPRGVRRNKRVEETPESVKPEVETQEETQKESVSTEKEYTPRRKTVETPADKTSRKSAASKYGSSQSAYLSTDRNKDKTDATEKNIDASATASSSENTAKKPDKPKLGASKYGQKPKFLSKYKTISENTSEENKKDNAKDEDRSEKRHDKSNKVEGQEVKKPIDDTDVLSLKDKIEQMKRSRKED